jgi:hypothetical protein
VAAFFVGIKFRDFRWWTVLGKQWPTTEQVIDWEKVEALASIESDA